MILVVFFFLFHFYYWNNVSLRSLSIFRRYRMSKCSWTSTDQIKNKTKIIKAMKDKLCPAKTMYFTNHSNNSFTRSFGFFIIYACCWLFFLWVLQTVYMFNLILCHFFIYCHWTFCTAVRKVTHRKKTKFDPRTKRANTAQLIFLCGPAKFT